MVICSSYGINWLPSGGAWYWFKDDGVMASGETVLISGVVNGFDASGAWIGVTEDYILLLSTYPSPAPPARGIFCARGWKSGADCDMI